MTHDHRHDEPGHVHDHDEPGHAAHDDEVAPGRADETRVVERQTYAEQRPVERGYVPPAAPPPAGGQVNLNPGGTSYVEAARGPLFYARRVLSLLFAVLAVLLALRIVLLALVANQQNDIVDFVYSATEPFVAPFRGIFQFDVVSPGGGSQLDIAAVVAFVGWLLVYLLLMAILSLADRDKAVA